MAAGARWCRRRDVLWRRSLDKVVLYRPEPDGGDALMVAGTGVDVWRLLDRPVGADEMSTSLASAYDADSQLVRRDVAALLDELERRGFVERTG